MGERTRVFVVDDHTVVRSGVRAEVGDTVDVVGEAGDVASAVSGSAPCSPTWCSSTCTCPMAAVGPSSTRSCRATRTSAFLGLSVSDAAEDVLDVIRGGARGYVTKAISGPDLCEAIRRVHAGDVYFSPRLAVYILDSFRGAEASGPEPDLDRLTRREREVLRLVAVGYTYQEIGTRLSISARTVESHAAAVLRKLQLSNRRELSRWASTRRLL
jgi:DNA-binding NarL/FixJ family response regulator